MSIDHQTLERLLDRAKVARNAKDDPHNYTVLQVQVEEALDIIYDLLQAMIIDDYIEYERELMS
jgi:hypothetical protein